MLGAVQENSQSFDTIQDCVETRQRCLKASCKRPELGNLTRRTFNLCFCIFCVFDIFGNLAVFRKSPQSLCIVFKQRSESPQTSAILRKTCAKHRENNSKKPARKISHTALIGNEPKPPGARVCSRAASETRATDFLETHEGVPLAGYP